MILYKRNASGAPIFWSIGTIKTFEADELIRVRYGLVGKEGRQENIRTHRDINKEIESLIKAKRKEGYKELKELHDNAPIVLPASDILSYLNTYLPKDNTHADGAFMPMLCKTLEDNKPFEKGEYFGQWKINGERCIITASIETNLFEEVKLHYRSREGIDWTSKLSYLTPYILPCIPQQLIDMMIEEGVGLDGELYLPGYGINEINSFIKNDKVPQHFQLQFWCYDICIDNMSAIKRNEMLITYLGKYLKYINTKEEHLGNRETLVILSSNYIEDFNDAIKYRDQFINLGFEGIVARKLDAPYQFGKRNNSMLKFKKIYDGWFEILDVIPEGVKRSHLGKFVLKNDINEETFTCTYNAPQYIQEQCLKEKDKYIGKKLAFVEYRERAGVKQVPFHQKILKFKDI